MVQTLSKATEVQIPIEEIEAALLKSAMPGMFGSVRIEFTIPAMTAAEIQVTISRNVVHKVGGQKTEQTYPLSVGTDRAQKVKNAIREIEDKLKVKISHRAIVAHFNDGVVTQFNLEDVL